jgi:hemoglobin
MNVRRALLLCAALAASACAKKVPAPVVAEVAVAPPAAPPPATPPLFERLGGHDGLTGIVDSFVSNLSADKRVTKFFGATKGPKLDYFKAMMVAKLCEMSGGGCEYTGKSMKDAHSRIGITDADFDAVVQDMGLALEEKQVDKDAQKELMDKLEAMHDDVVGAPRRPKK